jgi:hypothetical protein
MRDVSAVGSTPVFRRFVVTTVAGDFCCFHFRYQKDQTRNSYVLIFCTNDKPSKDHAERYATV